MTTPVRHLRRFPRAARALRKRAAFALPLVLLLALAGSLAVAVLLERQSTASLSVKRHLDAYQFHHVSAGMREMTTRWLKTIRGSLSESLEADGRAFTLQLPGGYRVDVYAEDGQGAALSDVSQLSGRRREIAEYVREYVKAYAKPEELDDALRPAGPAVISVASAPRIVLEGLAAACVEPDQVPAVVEALERLALQTSRPDLIQATDATSPLADLGLEPRARTELETLITTSPSVYRVVCVERGPAGRATWRAGGLMDMAAPRSTAAYDQGGPFLTWEDLPVLDEVSR